MPSPSRALVGCVAVVTIALGACAEDIAPGKPINGVDVGAGSANEVAEVDDSTRIVAFGYHDGNGIGTESVKSAAWTSSDTTSLQIIRRSSSSISSVATIKGLKPGLVTLSATLNGVTGSDSIRVIPHIQLLQLKATRINLSLGDTVEVWVRASDTNGDSIPNLKPFILYHPSSVFSFEYIGPSPRLRFRATASGPVQFTTRVANDSTQLTITVKEP